jgi:tetratricopeptide (TPR) repeat protein
LAGTKFYMGEYEQILPLLEEAYAVSTAAGNAWGQAYTLMLRGVVFLELGALQQALDTIATCLNLAVAGGFAAPLVEMRAVLGFLLVSMGQFDQADREIQAALETLGGQPSPQMTSLLTIEAYIQLLVGHVEAAAALLAQTRAQPVQVDFTSFTPLFEVLADAGMARARGDYSQAVAMVAGPIRVERELGMHIFRGDLQLAQARGLMGLGQLDEADAVLAEARSEAEARHLQRLLWELLAEQAELAERRGQAGLAAELRQQARGALETLAAQLVDPGLRASMLGQPRAHAPLAASPQRADDAP